MSDSFEPTEIIAGDTLAWTKDLSDYSAADGWQLSYRLRGNTNYDIVWGTHVTASGTSFAVSVPALTTHSWAAGDYWLFGFVTKGSERYQIIKVQVTVQPDSQTASQSFDGRSHAKKALEAIEATLEGNASREESMYEIDIAGKRRQLQFCTKEDLIKMRNYYKREVEFELKAERISKGLSGGGQILVRFVSPK
jgi:hypothetical protein